MTETEYGTHDSESLVIMEVFMNYKHYLKSCEYKVPVSTDYNNLHQFIDTKSLGFCQVCWAKELFCFHFFINYCYCKANRANDIPCYFKRSLDEKSVFPARNTQILHPTESFLTYAGISFIHIFHSSFILFHFVIICQINAFPQYVIFRKVSDKI